MLPCNIQLPLFGFLRIARGQAVADLLRGGPKPLLPLFTSRENAFLFAGRVGLNCVIVEFILPVPLLEFVRRPPGHPDDCQFVIALDLIDLDVDDFILLDRETFVHRLQDLVTPKPPPSDV